MPGKETHGDNALALLGSIAALPLMGLWGAVWWGQALSVLWGWFIVPLFALPVIGVWQAYGLTMTFAALRGLSRSNDPRTGIDLWLYLAISPPLACGLLVGTGWVVKALA